MASLTADAFNLRRSRALWDPRGLCLSRDCRGRRPDELRNRSSGYVSSSRGLCWPHPKGREPRRPARRAIDQVRIGHQPTDRQSDWPRHSTVAARPRRRGDRMIRREFITLLGGAVAWPLAARAQQSAMPVVGFLRSTPSAPFQNLVVACSRGLKEEGFVEGQNAVVDYR